MDVGTQASGVRYDSPMGNTCCSHIGNTCWELFCPEHGIQPLLPDTILDGGAGAFNTSFFVTGVDKHVSGCDVVVPEQMVMDVVFWQLLLPGMQATDGLIVDVDSFAGAPPVRLRTST